MKKTYLILPAILCFLAACAPRPVTQHTCIPPLTNFAYFTGQGTPYPDKPIAPSEPWVSANVTIDLKYPVLLGVRVLPTKDKEFWVWDVDVYSKNQKLFTFTASDTSLRPVLLDDRLSKFVLPIEKFFIAPDNSVWVVHRNLINSKVPILGKYDEVAGKITPIAKLGEIKPYLHYPITVLMDEKTGVFWFFVPHGHIYSYDPSLDKLIRHISIENMNPTAAVMRPDWKIYIYMSEYGSPQEFQDALFLYSPETETIKYTVIGLEADFFMKNLFIDHAERLWLGAFGWREPDGKWYQTLRSPAFVLASAEPRGERIYHWVPPDIKFETPSDIFWFTSSQGGTYSLDFKKGEWCWVSTSSYLEKDTDDNLWILVGKQLYYRPAMP